MEAPVPRRACRSGGSVPDRAPLAGHGAWCRVHGRVVLTVALLVLGGLPFATRCDAWADQDLTRWVDPFIGTGGHGHTFPGATLPFGMVQLSPDTRLEGWDGCSGYHYSDEVVYGFSHTHLSGTGVADYCDILFMPTTGVMHLDNGYPDRVDEGYASRFDKSTEHAEPGWYAMRLEDYGIDVELTATERTGLHRYVFPEGPPAQVILDLEHRDAVLDSWVRVVSSTEIEGMRRSSSWARDQWVYFVARFSRPIQFARLAVDDEVVLGLSPLQMESLVEVDSLDTATGVAGKSVKAAFSFGGNGGELLMKVGISAVDVDGARANLDSEQPEWEFDGVRAAAREKWNAQLNKIVVEGGSDEQHTVFYTALYHTMIAPNLFSDVDGRYRGMDQQIHLAVGREQYTVFSLWDTFRAAHPLYTLIEAERTNDFVATMLSQWEQSGRLPVWELAANETNCMIGYHSVSVIADAYVKRIRDYDVKLAERALKSEALARYEVRPGWESYQELHYLSSDVASESVSRTLEYAYDDWCVARFLEAYQRAHNFRRWEPLEPLYERSQAWRNLFDPSTTFLRARRNGGWLSPFDPRRVDFHHTEANAWQYRFFVPHDVQGLMRAVGGDEAFVSRLDSLFTAPEQTTGREQADITGLIGQYAHGNEPSHHVAWLYHYAGRPEKSAALIHRILDQLYRAEPDGLAGNEDCGQMSAWYVLCALGLYQVAPASGEWLLGAPLFPRATIQLEGDRRLEIRAPGASKGRIYVKDVERNDKPHPRSWIGHAELLRTARLDFALSERPEGAWGHAPEDRPRSTVPGDRIVPTPWVEPSPRTFDGELDLRLRCAEEGVSFGRCRSTALGRELDETLPTNPYVEIPDSLSITQSTTLCFAAQRASGRWSTPAHASLHRLPHDWTVEVLSTPNPQYTAGGNGALVDGLRGPEDWRTGGWQGYQDQDFVAVVDLKETLRLARVGAGFLQDMRSWIWMPRELIVSVSTDGREFSELGRVNHTVPDDFEGVFREDFVLEADGAEARYVKVEAVNYGSIPAWHPGAGGEAFLFVDEILIEEK